MKPSSGKLKLTTPNDCEIAFTRAFDAPRKLVFAAFTKPAMIKRWLLGPDGWTMPVCKMDLRVGGKFRWIWRHADGRKMGMGGVYREVAPPERVVFTEQFDEAWYAGGALITVTFLEDNGITTMTQTIRYDSKQARDSVLKSGMKRGVVASYNRLAEVLKPIPAKKRS